MRPETSLQIAIARPICVLLMMSVHVNPGFDARAHEGIMWAIGSIEVGVLGRASVSTLSLVSGFLLASMAERMTAWRYVQLRIAVLYLPMAAWNAVFVLLSAVAAMIGVRTSAWSAIEGMTLVQVVTEKIFYLWGEPASTALGFLRDMTISSAIIALTLKAGREFVLLTAPLVLVIAVFDAAEPIIYRPTILLFMLTGVLLHFYRKSLDVPNWLRPIIWAGFGVMIALELAPASGIGEPVGAIQNIVRRLVLAACILDICAMLATVQLGQRISAVSDTTYLAFLSHTTVISILWFGWRALVGDETHDFYVLFFLFAPVAAFALAMAAGGRLDALPWWLQIAIRGKAARSALAAPLTPAR